MTLTLAEIRRLGAQQIGDHRLLKATAVGSLNSFTDVRHLTEEDNSYAGCDIVFTSGTNQGENRYVTSSQLAGSTLNFQPNLLTIPQIGDLAELFNYRGMGLAVDEWDSFANSAILYAQEDAEVRVQGVLGSFAVTDAWTWTDAYYPQSLVIPAKFKKATSIYYTKDGLTYYPERGHPAKHEGWWIDATNRRVVIEGGLPAEMDGGVVYLVGFGPPETLNSDDDGTEINPEWLLAKVKALAYARLVSKGLGDRRPDVALWEGMAERASRQLRPMQYPANTVELLA